MHADNDEPFFQEFAVNLRWLCHYATRCLDRATDARYSALLAAAAALSHALPSSATAVCSLATLPLGALQVAAEGALYLLVAEALLGGCPPTMHAFLDHVEEAKRREVSRDASRDVGSSSSVQTSSMRRSVSDSIDVCTIASLTTEELDAALPPNRSRTSTQAQAMLLLLRWLVTEQVVESDALAETLQLTSAGGERNPVETSSNRRRREVAMATQAAQVSPFYLGTHVLLTRALLQRHCTAITTSEDIHHHSQLIAGDAWQTVHSLSSWRGAGAGSSIEHDMHLWVDCVLARLEEEVKSQRALLSGSPNSTRRRVPRTNPQFASNAASATEQTLEYLRVRRLHTGQRPTSSTTNLVASLRDGVDVCYLLHFYEPQLLPLASVQLPERVAAGTENNSKVGDGPAREADAPWSRDDAGRAMWNWGCVLRVLGILGVWPGMTEEEVVTLAASVLPLHVLRILEEAFVLLATHAEEGVRNSRDVEQEASVFTSGEVPCSLSASTIVVEPYLASRASAPTVLPSFSLSGREHGAFAPRQSNTAAKVVMRSSSRPFHSVTASPQRASLDVASDSDDLRLSTAAPQPVRPPVSVVPEWDVSRDDDDGEHQTREPVRPLAKKRHSGSTVSSTRGSAGAGLPWLSMADPVLVASQEAARRVTQRPISATSPSDLVQSSHSSISSVYAVSDDVTETENPAYAATSATDVARSRFTVTRTFSKPVEEPSAAAVVLQSSLDSASAMTSSALSLFAAASTPLADGSPPFGVYSTPKRSIKPDGSRRDVDTPSSVEQASGTQETESAHEECRDGTPIPHVQTRSFEASTVPQRTLVSVTVPPNAPNVAEPLTTPLDNVFSPQAHSVESPDFFASPDDLSSTTSRGDVQSATLRHRVSGAIELVQFASLTSAGRGIDEEDCDEPSVTINVDEPPDSETARPGDTGSVPARATEPLPSPPSVAESGALPDPSGGARVSNSADDDVQGGQRCTSPLSTAASSTPAAPHTVSPPTSSDDDSTTSEFVVRRLSLPQPVSPVVVAEKVPLTPLLGAPSAVVPTTAAVTPPPVADDDELSAQTPESVSVEETGHPYDRSLDDATVYGSQNPSGVNDSWFSSVSRPGARQVGSPWRSADRATLLETVQEQQRMIEHLTDLLQGRARPAPRRVDPADSLDRALSSAGARSVERVIGPSASVATTASAQLAESDVTTSLQRHLDENSDGESAWSPGARAPSL